MKQNIKDMLGRDVQLELPPLRIISLVPSQTELLYTLGLEKEVVGITRFCVHPEKWVNQKVKVGGTKKINFNTIKSLNPDLIIANKEENNKEDIEQLALNYPVWVSDVSTVNEALQMIAEVSHLVNKEKAGSMLLSQISANYNQLKNEKNGLKTAYLIWNKPLMVACGDTFIGDNLRLLGLENAFNSKSRYPTTSIDELKALGVELLLLSSEPYPFKEKHLAYFTEQLPGVEIKLVDGEYFSWYGSRMLDAPQYFMELFKQ